MIAQNSVASLGRSGIYDTLNRRKWPNSVPEIIIIITSEEHQVYTFYCIVIQGHRPKIYDTKNTTREKVYYVHCEIEYIKTR